MKHILFTFLFFFITTTSYSQEFTLEEFATGIVETFEEQDWTVVCKNYSRANSEYGFPSGRIDFVHPNKYLAIFLVEDCPYYTPYIVYRDSAYIEYEEENELEVIGNLKVVTAGFECEENEMGQYVGRIDSDEFYNCFFALFTREY